MLSEYLDQELILPDLVASSRMELLRALVNAAAAKRPELDAEETLRLVLEREKLGSTALGHGVAVPHAKLEACEDILVVVGRSRNGISFAASDDVPCKIFFLVLSPVFGRMKHLNLLGNIAEICKSANLRERLLRTKSAAEIKEILTAPPG